MKQLSRVVWYEGMHLAQHQFQAQSRYFEDSIHFALSNLFFCAYGLAGFELDRDALHNGTVSLLHARGVFPDGLAFHIQAPEGDAPPPPRPIRDVFSPTQDSHLLYLVIAPFRRDGANTAGLQGDGAGDDMRGMPGTDSRRARFRYESRLVVDETSGRDERSVGVGQKNFRLLLDLELRDGDVALPLGRIRRDKAGHFMYDPDYIPPLLQTGASDALMELLQRLIEMLGAKSAALGEQRRGGPGEFAAREIASFWLLHTIHSSLPSLRHHLESRRTRPEELYVELSRLAGALCTFALHAHPRTLPLYEHERLDHTFGALERHIREHLELIFPEDCLTIPLARQSTVIHGAEVADTRAFGRARWILGVRGGLGTVELAHRVSQFVKVCSRKWLQVMVDRALPGVLLEQLTSPPPSVRPRSDTVYFALTQGGECWASIRKHRDLGVYVPDAIPGAEVELLVVLET